MATLYHFHLQYIRASRISLVTRRCVFNVTQKFVPLRFSITFTASSLGKRLGSVISPFATNSFPSSIATLLLLFRYATLFLPIFLLPLQEDCPKIFKLSTLYFNQHWMISSRALFELLNVWKMVF